MTAPPSDTLCRKVESQRPSCAEDPPAQKGGPEDASNLRHPDSIIRDLIVGIPCPKEDQDVTLVSPHRQSFVDLERRRHLSPTREQECVHVVKVAGPAGSTVMAAVPRTVAQTACTVQAPALVGV